MTTKVNLVSKTGVLPLGLSDHCLIYATLKLNSENPAPTNIRTTNFKHSVMTRILSRMLIEYHFTLQQFSRTNKVSCGPGSNCSVAFVINTHHTQFWKHEACPPHGLIYRSRSKWIEDSKCLRKPNQRGWPVGWLQKKLRNKIISNIRKARTAYFKRKFDEVKTTSTYWNLL